MLRQSNVRMDISRKEYNGVIFDSMSEVFGGLSWLAAAFPTVVLMISELMGPGMLKCTFPLESVCLGLFFFPSMITITSTLLIQWNHIWRGKTVANTLTVMNWLSDNQDLNIILAVLDHLGQRYKRLSKFKEFNLIQFKFYSANLQQM